MGHGGVGSRCPVFQADRSTGIAAVFVIIKVVNTVIATTERGVDGDITENADISSPFLCFQL